MPYFGPAGHADDGRKGFAHAFKEQSTWLETKAIEEANSEVKQGALTEWTDNTTKDVLVGLREDFRENCYDKTKPIKHCRCVKDELKGSDFGSASFFEQAYQKKFDKDKNRFIYPLSNLLEKENLPLDKQNLSLNPLKRFSGYRSVSTYESSLDQVSSIEGNYFELLTAKHCHNNMSVVCQNEDCNEVGTIEWAGGGGTSWQDFYCTACGAYYEMKSKNEKQTTKYVEASYHKKVFEINGGSYSRFVKQDLQKIKHFLIIINRENKPSLLENRHSVYCARILFVRPRFDKKAFAQFNSGKYMSVKSNVFFEKAKSWFTLPVQKDFPAPDYFRQIILEDAFGERVKKIQAVTRDRKSVV